MKEFIICAAVWYKEIELKKNMPINTYLPKNLDKGIVFVTTGTVNVFILKMQLQV